jgi:hypothetical protein
MSAVRHNIYVSVSENKEVVKGLNLLSTCLIHVKSVSVYFKLISWFIFELSALVC